MPRALLKKDPKFGEQFFLKKKKKLGDIKKKFSLHFFFTIKNAKKLSNIRYKGKTNLNK